MLTSHALRDLGADVVEVDSREATFLKIGLTRPRSIVLTATPLRAPAGCAMPSSWAYTRIPILGICNGCQALGLALGASIKRCHGATGKVELVSLEGRGRLLQPGGSSMGVFMNHEYALADPLPDDLLVTARSPDGNIAAFEHKDRYLFGVQFHPESPATPAGSRVLERFIEVARALH